MNPPEAVNDIYKLLPDHEEQMILVLAEQEGVSPETVRHFLMLRNELLRLESRIKSLNLAIEPDEYHACMGEIRALLCREDNPEVSLLFQKSDYCEFLKERLRQPNHFYVRAVENNEAISILSNRNLYQGTDLVDLIQRDELRVRFQKKVTDLSSLDLSNAKSVVVVGSGNFPETVLHFYQNTEIPIIIGLDWEYGATITAGRIVADLQRNQEHKRIRLDQGMGQLYPYHGVDIVHIAGYIDNKIEVINQVIETAGKGTQITLENYANALMHLLHDDVMDEIKKMGRIQVVDIHESVSGYVRKQIVTLKVKEHHF